MKKKIVLFVTILLLFGCTMQGEITNKHENMQMLCTDTKDNTTFTYNTNTITNVRIGVVGAPKVEFNIIDDKGIKRTLNSDMDTYLKCEERR